MENFILSEVMGDNCHELKFRANLLLKNFHSILISNAEEINLIAVWTCLNVSFIAFGVD